MIDWHQWLSGWLTQSGFWALILAGIIEQVVVPIPSPLVPMLGGVLFVAKNLTGLSLLKTLFFRVALPFSIGSTLGSTLVYLIAWSGGKWLIDKFHRWLEFGWAEVEGLKMRYFSGKKTDELLIFLFRAIPVIPSVLISAVAGAMRLNPMGFYFFTWLGLLVRGLVLGWLGWESGEMVFQVSRGLDRWETMVTFLILLLSGGVLCWAYLRREKWLTSLKRQKPN